MSVKFVAVGAGVVSSVIGSKASKKAASAQAQAAADAQALQQQQYEQTREDNAPFRARGNAAGNRLNQLLGLDVGPIGDGNSGYENTESNFDGAAYLRANPDVADPARWSHSPFHHWETYGKNEGRAFTPTANAQQIAATNAESKYDPSYGSLLRKFTMADRDADPVYQSGLEFGLSEGRRAVDNRFAAAGSSLSGAALKALTRFGNDYASTKAGESRNRYVQDQDATYNRLAGVAGTGQTATRDVSNAGANYANQAGNAIMGGGEARAAGYLGQANSINNGISTGYGMYQGNQLMDLIRQGGSRKAGWGSSGGWTGGGRTVPDYPGAEY